MMLEITLIKSPIGRPPKHRVTVKTLGLTKMHKTVRLEETELARLLQHAVARANQVLLGYNGQAGELGHQTIEPDGPWCGCGNRGCLETLASGRGIARQAAEGLARKRSDLLERLTHGRIDSVTAQDVVGAVGQYRCDEQWDIVGVVGAVSINMLGEMLRPLALYKWIVIPLLLILVMIYRPRGLVSFKEFNLRKMLAPRGEKV